MKAAEHVGRYIRVTPSACIRYRRLLHKERFNLSTGEPTGDYARANFYLTYKYAISPTSQLSNTAYFQPRFSDTSDYYASNGLALTVKINNRLALELNVETQYDNKPVDNPEKD